jgi:hypothetical protein
MTEEQEAGKAASDNSFALDFDGWDVVFEWFGSWEQVLSSSQRTRIEWHQDNCSYYYRYNNGSEGCQSSKKGAVINQH